MQKPLPFAKTEILAYNHSNRKSEEPYEQTDEKKL